MMQFNESTNILFPSRNTSAAQRRQNILKHIEQNPGVTTNELIELFDTSNQPFNKQQFKRYSLQPLAVEGLIHSNPKGAIAGI